MTLAALEAEAVQLIDVAVEQLESALSSFRSGDHRLAGHVLTAARQAHAGADRLYESALTILGDGAPPSSELRRRAALLHVAARIRHIHSELATIADLTARGEDAMPASDQHARALGLMGTLTRSRLARARDAYARLSWEPVAETLATPPELGVLSAPVLAGPSVAVARCLERIEDDATEIGEQALFVSDGFFQELADSPRLGDGEPPGRSLLSAP
jgi:phosphate transport system protein